METSTCIIPVQRGHNYVHWTAFPGENDRWHSLGAGTVVFFMLLIGPGMQGRSSLLLNEEHAVKFLKVEYHKNPKK